MKTGNQALASSAPPGFKPARDHLLTELQNVYPVYGFARHKGYGTAQHLAMLGRYGPCVEHRHTFAPVARNVTLLDQTG